MGLAVVVLALVAVSVDAQVEAIAAGQNGGVSTSGRFITTEDFASFPETTYPGAALRDIAFGADNLGVPLWVAVESGNKVWYSYNGTAWESTLVAGGPAPTADRRLVHPAFGEDGSGNPLWVATAWRSGVAGGNANAGSISTSADGKTWAQVLSLNQPMRAVGFGTDETGARQWVALGEGGMARYSSNGASWSAGSGIASTIGMEAVQYGLDSNGDPLWIAVGQGSSGAREIYRSSNGRTWSSAGITIPATYTGSLSTLFGVAFDGSDTWVAAGGVGLLTSMDGGLTWTHTLTSSSPEFYRSVTYHGGSGEWYAVGGSVSNAYMKRSTNGAAWTTVPLTGSGVLNGVAAVPLPPLVGFDSASSEALESVGDRDLEVTLSRQKSVPVTVDFTITAPAQVHLLAPADDPAGDGCDHASQPDGLASNATTSDGGATLTGTITFDPGETSATISLQICDDFEPEEGSEGFNVTLSNPVQALLGETATHAFTVHDNDLPITVTPLPGGEALVEGNAGSVTRSYTLTMPALPARTYSAFVDVEAVELLTGDPASGEASCADAGADFRTGLTGDMDGSGTVEFAPGVNSRSVSFTVCGDLDAEVDETFQLRFHSVQDTCLFVSAADPCAAEQSRNLTIRNDDLRVVTVADHSGSESGGNIPFTITIDPALPSAATLNYWTEHPSGAGFAAAGASCAAAGTDVVEIPQASPQQVTVPAGETSVQVSVAPCDDPVKEGSEAFRLRLGLPSGGAFVDGSDPEAVGTIYDDDVMVEVVDGSGDEGTAAPTQASFVARLLDGASAATLSFSYSTAAGTATGGASCTAGVDFVHQSGTVLVTAGSTESDPILVEVCPESLFEIEESFTLTVAGSFLAGSDPTGSWSVQNDDAAPTAFFPDPAVQVKEGQTALAKVRLSQASAVGATVKVTWAPASASAADFVQPAPVTLAFAPGVTERTVVVEATSDGVLEPTESFTLGLSDATQAQLPATLTMPVQILDVTTPTLNHVTPSQGSLGGGTIVTLSGNAFRTDSVVRFGTVAAASMTFVDLTTLRVVAPAQPEGRVTVTVTNPETDGNLVSGGQNYYYVVEPTVLPYSGTTLYARAGGPVTVDGGALVELDASGSDASAVRFQWEQIAGPSVSLQEAESPKAKFLAPAAGSADLVLRFRLQVHDSGEGSASDEMSVTVRAAGEAAPPQPTPQPAPNPTIAAAVSDLSVAFTGPAGTQHSWDFGDGSTSQQAAPRHTYAQPGSYSVRLEMTLPDGNETVVTRMVTVSAAPVDPGTPVEAGPAPARSDANVESQEGSWVETPLFIAVASGLGLFGLIFLVLVIVLVVRRRNDLAEGVSG